jgi:predicted cobalt transporter CbtA
MVGRLLTRGMLAGILAGVLCFAFLKVFGEPQVDRAIAFETQMDEAKEHAHGPMSMPMEKAEPELVSRSTQAGIGLFTGVVIYCAAFGGLFALAFALAYGRLANLDARATSVVLAALGFVAVYAVPNLKYPANPPAVGAPETLGMRTEFYFAMIALSLAAMIAAAMLRKRLVGRFGVWNASIIAGGAYLVAAIALGLALPSVNEVPEQFPAVVLWQFRVASFGAQLIMWATIGLVFGVLAERVLSQGAYGAPASSS